MQVDLSRFRDTFFEEAAEHVVRIEQSLLALEDSTDPRDLLDGIFRAAHSIKGASGVFAFTDVMRFTHVLESVLDRLREGTLHCDRALTDLLLRANDVLKGLLEAAQSGDGAPTATETVLAALNAVLGAPAPEVAPAAAAAETGPALERFRIRFRPAADLFRQGLDPQVLLRELSELGTIVSADFNDSAVPLDGSFDPETCYVSWVLIVETAANERAVRDVFLFAEDGAELEIGPASAVPAPVAAAVATPEAAAPASAPVTAAAPPAARPADERRAGGDRRKSLEGASLRVSTEKVDRLIDLVGELVISQSMVATMAERVAASGNTELADAVATLERNTRELQAQVLAIRMVPIGGVFSRFPRLVRDIASSLSKNVRVEMSGEETELDKGVVEQIGDPLTHLVRNSVDHGLESPEARVAAGKPAEGVIRMSAYTRGGAVVIEVADDGKGLDTERIRAKALAQGLITADQTLSTDAIHQLIFAAGFSTAAAVSNLSGRGVGMDVVKRNVEALNGTVTVESRPGEGTCVRISLPLTLAILDGQSVAIGTTTYVLPLTSIVESLRPKRNEVVAVLGAGEVVRVRGEAVPLIRLHRRLGLTAAHEDPCEGIVVLVENQGSQAALLVDELRGQHQVVIKSLDAHYRRVDGVMGATIMGDGSVAFILDVPGLLRMPERRDATGNTAAA